ncbi:MULTISPECIES: MarR family transcriptional regulator [unclassified Chelatococcus]|jgi:DNA-binding MarR family transcriptional regulator|uniref:MarR family winged helix-turn-helix transcriptional regulator n=1 Tax=unclassified Chelatococcus TaxID=2638111 RepID=UPI001BCA9C7A|nr:MULTISPECIES: MarR family transcriptional regulator [unclassified Chelatococcus]CAH1658091.1 HTH-type transcriptional repressor NicR [Hyphomicrobiales bacterium]MBS7742219.1 MarR family transcriptional regulator [Chelatococcus sp. HY11]MBX3542663.1 MarR family transcriptional regulator [Chelatococcus sp.]MCO5075121.1 MarR family transcriptional regulator [Chelatococcus sp.]CAH1689573.1 HTH-type transcriptional repressor NicR [Hyphomicrobiales bacterium]
MPASPSVSDLTSHLGYWLRMVSNHVSHAFAVKLAGEDVTVAEWSFMRALYGREPTPPSRLAEAMGMTKGAITKLADRLIAKSLVTRAANANDGRAQTLVLTVRGAALVPKLAALADGNDAEFFECLTGAERALLERLLMRMVEHHRLGATPVE